MIETYEFPVLEKPVYVDGQVLKDYKAIVRDDNNKPLAVVSQDYKLIPHKDVVETTTMLLDAKIGRGNYKANHVLTQDGARLFSEYKFSENVEIRDCDFVQPGVRVTNSYDGSIRIFVELIGMRQVCSNGLTIPGWVTKAKRKHMGEIDIEGLEPLIGGALDQLEVYYDVMREAAKTPVAYKEAEELIEGNKLGKKYKELALVNLNEQKLDQLTMWDVYNALTYATTHLEPKGRTYEGERRAELMAVQGLGTKR